ncbi:hypothetical protein MMC21_003701 [Puttea exsequens]|nr:hypothetical protein [Puttea exsequens]
MPKISSLLLLATLYAGTLAKPAVHSPSKVKRFTVPTTWAPNAAAFEAANYENTDYHAFETGTDTIPTSLADKIIASDAAAIETATSSTNSSSRRVGLLEQDDELHGKINCWPFDGSRAKVSNPVDCIGIVQNFWQQPHPLQLVRFAEPAWWLNGSCISMLWPDHEGDVDNFTMLDLAYWGSHIWRSCYSPVFGFTGGYVYRIGSNRLYAVSLEAPQSGG